jgi:hypothetical protein
MEGSVTLDEMLGGRLWLRNVSGLVEQTEDFGFRDQGTAHNGSASFQLTALDQPKNGMVQTAEHGSGFLHRESQPPSLGITSRNQLNAHG